MGGGSVMQSFTNGGNVYRLNQSNIEYGVDNSFDIGGMNQKLR